MTYVAPQSRKLATTIKELASASFANQETKILFLGVNATQLAVIDPTKVGHGELVAKRQELLNAGTLRAVAYIGVARSPLVQVTLVEVIAERDFNGVHALLTWGYTGSWIPVPKSARDRYTNFWTGKEYTS